MRNEAFASLISTKSLQKLYNKELWRTSPQGFYILMNVTNFSNFLLGAVYPRMVYSNKSGGIINPFL